AADGKLRLELAGTLLTGIAAVLAAFELSLPDRRSGWALLPIPPLLLWVASSGYACYSHWIVLGPRVWWMCVRGPCVPVHPLVRRRAQPLAPARVAALGGLGVAALAAFLLQFFHPFDVTFMDLAIHGLAVGIVVGVASLGSRLARAG